MQLKIVFGQDVADKIVIRAKDNSWGGSGTTETYLVFESCLFYSPARCTPFPAGETAKEGKQKFLASAAEQFQRLHGVEITRNSTLLIDDDHRNIQIALERGVRAVWFIPDEPEK